MRTRPLRPNIAMAIVAFTVLFGVMLACVRAIQPQEAANFVASGQGSLSSSGEKALLPATRRPGDPVRTPTPDPPHPLPAARSQPEQYTVQAGDSLGAIAQSHGISIQELVSANQLANPDHLEVGQVLEIPVAAPADAGPSFKMIPDSELVYGPASVNFDIAAFIKSKGGYLAQYQEEVDGVTLDSAQIVQKVAQNYSVNPRLLLAVLEYRSRWVTDANPKQSTMDDQLGIHDPLRTTLYPQLSWAANSLNRGFYLWKVGGASTWLLADGSVVPIDPTINAGTAGVQNFLAQLMGQQDWREAVSENGFFTTYNELFGYPFDLAVEPLLPPDLKQPALQLPFDKGKEWSFTGGPHGGWDTGSAWAALDFAPPSDQLGCVESNEWVTAMADGPVLRTGTGQVIQDLDGDGHEQTGWVLLYMHVESRDRVSPGTTLKTGDRVGHPSCEGGVSNGTHVHVARRYNGEWIPADQNFPFVLDGWVSRGTGTEYDGFLERNGQSIEAYAGRKPENQIER